MHCKAVVTNRVLSINASFDHCGKAFPACALHVTFSLFFCLLQGLWQACYSIRASFPTSYVAYHQMKSKVLSYREVQPGRAPEVSTKLWPAPEVRAKAGPGHRQL